MRVIISKNQSSGSNIYFLDEWTYNGMGKPNVSFVSFTNTYKDQQGQPMAVRIDSLELWLGVGSGYFYRGGDPVTGTDLSAFTTYLTANNTTSNSITISNIVSATNGYPNYYNIGSWVKYTITFNGGVTIAKNASILIGISTPFASVSGGKVLCMNAGQYSKLDSYINITTIPNQVVLSYSKNVGSSGDTVSPSLPTAQSYNVGTIVNVANPNNYTRTHGTATYTGQSWNTKSDGTGTTYHKNSSITLASDTTLYARWGYSITYDANNGYNPPSQQTQVYGSNLTITSGVPSRTGYKFNGWNTKPDGSGTSYAAGNAFSYTNGNTRLYAQWLYSSFIWRYNSSLDKWEHFGRMWIYKNGSWQIPTEGELPIWVYENGAWRKH